MMSMVGTGMAFGNANNYDDDIQIEDEDPFIAVQKDLAKGLKNIRESFTTGARPFGATVSNGARF
jgi:hypothetical protein